MKKDVNTMFSATSKSSGVHIAAVALAKPPGPLLDPFGIIVVNEGVPNDRAVAAQEGNAGTMRLHRVLQSLGVKERAVDKTVPLLSFYHLGVGR